MARLSSLAAKPSPWSIQTGSAWQRKRQLPLRGADWDPAKLPEGMRQEAIIVRTEDGASVRGLLYSLGGETTAVTLQHPREAIATHYMVPELLAGGVAVYLQFPRMVGNDIRLEHERALFDVAASVRMLKGRSYEKVPSWQLGWRGPFHLLPSTGERRTCGSHRAQSGRAAHRARGRQSSCSGWTDPSVPPYGTGGALPYGA